MVDHASRAHAVCSASGAHRWMQCTAAPLLEAQFPNSTSEAAAEGTLAHEICECKLTGRDWTVFKDDPLYAPEMDGYTDYYTGAVKRLRMQYDAEPFMAVEVRLDLQGIIPDGFGTCDCLMIGGDEIQVIDFKYGKGVPVSAEGNPQLLIYAWGAWQHFKPLFPDLKRARVTIIQPRIDNDSSWEINLDDLEKFADKVREKAQEAMSGQGVQHPGDWCRFCRARNQCRARAEKAVELAGFTDKKPPLISNDEVGRYLKLGDQVAAWLSDLKEYALSECLAGRSVDGWKAVEGRSTRKWADENAALKTLIDAGIDRAIIYDYAPKSLAKLEKAIGKKELYDIAGDQIVKPIGKPTLVPAEDKRDAISTITAKEAFNHE